MPEFIPGLKLSRLFYADVVRPRLEADFPSLSSSAALIGSGSEVLGFDTAMSTDHHWGPRVMVFLRENDFAQYADAIHERLRHTLPHDFMGYPTNFAPPDPDDHGTQLLQPTTDGPVNHRVELLTLRGYFRDYLAFDTDGPLETADWLTFSEQKLRSITAGAVFHDDIGLEVVRERLRYYPHDVWLYLLASDWTRISQDEHLIGRAGFAGDEIGAGIIGARLVRDIMHLCFLMERQYAPYAKWFGTAFGRLACADRLAPPLRQALHADSWQDRQRHLAAAYEIIAAQHNALGLTPPLPEKAVGFFGRPFQVIFGERFARALCAQITDPGVKRLTGRPLIGSLEQFSDSTDLCSDAAWRQTLRGLYE